MRLIGAVRGDTLWRNAPNRRCAFADPPAASPLLGQLRLTALPHEVPLLIAYQRRTSLICKNAGGTRPIFSLRRFKTSQNFQCLLLPWPFSLPVNKLVRIRHGLSFFSHGVAGIEILLRRCAPLNTSMNAHKLS